MKDVTERDLELAEQALKFVLLSDAEERIANVALLFALARSEGRCAAGEEIRILLFETPLSDDAKVEQ